jgi:hypothetical protein
MVSWQTDGRNALNLDALSDRFARRMVSLRKPSLIRLGFIEPILAGLNEGKGIQL